MTRHNARGLAELAGRRIDLYAQPLPLVTPKDERLCCVARALPDGRLPIGFCSPECVGRAERDELLNLHSFLTAERRWPRPGELSRG